MVLGFTFVRDDLIKMVRQVPDGVRITLIDGSEVTVSNQFYEEKEYREALWLLSKQQK